MARTMRRHGASRCKGLVAVGGFVLATYAVLHMLLHHGIHGSTNATIHEAAATHLASSCPLAAVDWSPYIDPGDTPGGVVSIFATNFTDSSLLWLISGLHSMQYQVELIALSYQAAEAKRFMSHAQEASSIASKGTVRLQVAKLQGFTLSGATTKVFVHVCDDTVPQVMGKGRANILLMRPPQPGALRSPLARNTLTMPISDEAQLLASYDYVLYTSTASFAQHNPTMSRMLKLLQQQDRMFPLLDVLPFPASPVRFNDGYRQRAAGIPAVTLSMSKYEVSKQGLLSEALEAFQALSRASPGQVRLVICTWLLPGITDDLSYLNSQVAALDLTHLLEVRTEGEDPGSMYAGISVQWHLDNQDVRPQFSGLAAMPAGVWVLDCTGTLNTTEPKLAYAASPSVAALAHLTTQFLQNSPAEQQTTREKVVNQSLEPIGKMFNAKVFQVVHRSFRSKVIRFFMQNSLGAYKARLTPAIQRARASTASVDQDSRYAAVIVEARPHYAFLYAVLNAAWYLPGWDLHVVHSRLNGDFVKSLLEPHVNVKYHQLDATNVDIDDYNLLMKNATFWQMLEADHILLFQTDSLILRPGLDKFARFDYIGAPWHLENERWSQPALKAALPAGVGNGGFSLRSSKAMVDICKRLSATSPLKEQEDLFFALHVEASERFQLADRQSAYSFCLEVPCHDMAFTQPHAVHAAWYYNDLPVMQQLLDSSLLDLAHAACVN